MADVILAARIGSSSILGAFVGEFDHDLPLAVLLQVADDVINLPLSVELRGRTLTAKYHLV